MKSFAEVIFEQSLEKSRMQALRLSETRHLMSTRIAGANAWSTGVTKKCVDKTVIERKNWRHERGKIMMEGHIIGLRQFY